MPCPRDLVALAHFLTDPGELEAFVAHCAARGDRLRDVVHDMLVLAMDEDADEIVREVFLKEVTGS